MKCFILVNRGLEQLAVQEVGELLSAKGEVVDGVIEFQFPSTAALKTAFPQFQSARRLVVAIARVESLGELNLDTLDFPWCDFFSSEITFKIEVEKVKGQDKRTAIAKLVAQKLFALLEKQSIHPHLKLKDPQRVIIVFFTGKEYILGIDLAGKELNQRAYRLFPHSGSFKGDFGYFFIRNSQFQPGEKLVIGFMKDGVLPIEAALFAKHHGCITKTITAFDMALPNVIAARKNTKLAQVYDLVEINKWALDELDIKFQEQEVDRLIFHVTLKDEEKLNEMYYQANYILKPKGTLLFIGRKNWELSLSSKFKLLQQGELQRGDSIYQWWLLEKK